MEELNWRSPSNGEVSDNHCCGLRWIHLFDAIAEYLDVLLLLAIDDILKIQECHVVPTGI